ncbi:hypothetical protein EMPS_09108 [Entomortierella parvispora]|uniref:Uncharacterized protein n=1 Tax=Entomortierella parvispora TaxID=205924 RepID=A0A9P3LZY5_9FUNG|nr:hypothetical protein EMPS_09108 [Entomortierella parvispora]
MDVQVVSSITKLANYMPLGSYVIYTALETYSFSLGATPTPVTTIVQTPSSNYTCYYVPGASFTYTTCTDDQANALEISLCIGFFLAVFLSFLKQVPPGGTPPLADTDDDSDDEDSSADSTGTSTGNGEVSQGQQTTDNSTQTRVNGSSSGTLVQRKTSTSKSTTATTTHHKKKKEPAKPKYRAGIVYAEGNYYYLDFGDTHIWGHALLSFVAFGTLSLFSASVSQCLFPSIKPWIFVFTQIILLVICCFIAMFWIDDPSLSIGLMVVPQTAQSTQTSNGAVPTYNPATLSPPPATTTAATTTSYNAATSTSVAMSPSSSMSPNMTMSFNPSPTSAGLANVALDSTAINAIMGQVSNNRSTAAFSVNSNRSATSISGGTGVGSGSGAAANIASGQIVGGSGGLGSNVGNVSRVSLFSSPCSQNQASPVGEKGEWIAESDGQEEEPFSVKVE